MTENTEDTKPPNKYFNQFTLALAAIVVVVLINGFNQTSILNEQQRILHNVCDAANATADVWNRIITQSIDAESKSKDTPEQKAQQIEALRKDRFPNQEC